MHEAAVPGQRRGGRHRKPSAPVPGAAVITTGAFALVPLALSTGTAEAAQAAPAVAPAPSVDWTPIIKCESGNNPKAQNRSSTASGLYQFLDSSWKAYGGGKYAARAKDATVAQQTEIAEAAFRRSGLSPWKASQRCWGGKVNTKAKPKTAPAPAKIPVIREVVGQIKPAPAKPATPAPARPVTAPLTTLPGVPVSGMALPGMPVPAALLPAAAPAPAATPAPAAPLPGPAGEAYVVKPGDSLAKIASSRGISWQSLWEANKASVARPDLLHPGEQLQMPKAPGQL